MDSDSIEDTPSHDAMVALIALGTFQSYLQHADTKVSTLWAVLAGSAAAMMTTATESPIPFVLIYIAAFLGAVFHLGQALRPRLGPHGNIGTPSSAFGIMGVAERLPADAAAQRDEAWTMVRTLAGSAKTKHRHVVRALPWTVASVATSVASVAWTAIAG